MHEDKPNALWCWWYFRKECFSGFVLKQPYVQWLQFEFTQLSSSWVLSLKNNIQSFGSFGFGTKNVLNILCAYWKLTGNKLGFDKCEFYIRKKNTKPNKKPRNEIEDKIARKLKKKTWKLFKENLTPLNCISLQASWLSFERSYESANRLFKQFTKVLWPGVVFASEAYVKKF